MKTRGIVMSGLPGSGKSVLCKKLQAEYGWPVYSMGDMLRAKWKGEHPKGDVEFPVWWQGTSNEYNFKINEEMRAKMEKEDLIIDSRYTPFYSMDLPFLRVFLTADLEVRAKRGVKKYEGKNISEICQLLKLREEDEVTRGFVLFGRDYRDPCFYQFTLDSGRMTIKQEFDAVRKVISDLG